MKNIEKIEIMKTSLEKNATIKKLITAIEVVFKQINILFKSVQASNQNTINVFRKSMFSKLLFI